MPNYSNSTPPIAFEEITGGGLHESRRSPEPTRTEKKVRGARQPPARLSPRSQAGADLR